MNFVEEFKKDPDSWRSRLSEDELKMVKKSLTNILETAPTTDKLEIEAKIIMRRYPKITQMQKVSVNESALIFPTRLATNKMLFWKYMWGKNREAIIKKYMTAEYDMQDVMSVLAQKFKPKKVTSKKVQTNTGLEASFIWKNYLRGDKEKFRKAIFKLFEEHNKVYEIEEDNEVFVEASSDTE